METSFDSFFCRYLKILIRRAIAQTENKTNVHGALIGE